MIRKSLSLVLIIFLIVSCANTENTSFDDYKQSFYQWNLNYSPSIYFITTNDPLLYKKRFIGDEYINDIKRFLIELNQINFRKISSENQLVYSSIDKFLKNNIYINETLKFDEWNSLYSISNFYKHALYIGKILDHYKPLDINIVDPDLLISEVEFLNDNILFFLENIKYKHTSELEILALENVVNKIQNFSETLFSNEIIKYPGTNIVYEINQLIFSIDKLSNWKHKHYAKLDSRPYEFSKISYKKYIHLNSDYKIDLEGILDKAFTDLREYEKKLFNYSLPIYLENNDEPVWTDFSDTINVVHGALDTLSNYMYHCSDKDELFNFVNTGMSALFNERLYKDINVNIKTNTKLDKQHDFNFFNFIDEKDLYVTSSQSHNMLFDNFYYTLNIIYPGDFFIYDQILKIGNDFNSIYLNNNFFYGYKFLLLNYFLHSESSISNDLEICGTRYSEYIKAMELFYIRDRIIDAIAAIATIEYFIGGHLITESINRNDQLVLIDETKNNILLEEIFTYKIDSITKFTSINKLQTLIEGMDQSELERLLRLLYNNPNSSLVLIEKLFKK